MIGVLGDAYPFGKTGVVGDVVCSDALDLCAVIESLDVL